MPTQIAPDEVRTASVKVNSGAGGNCMPLNLRNGYTRDTGMPATKKPRKKYRPKSVILNTMEFVKESIKPLAEHDSYVIDWKLKNHVAFATLLRGEAKKAQLDTLVAARNICEALVVTLKGQDIDGTLTRSAVALIEVCARANAGKGTAMRAPEMQAMRDLMAFHDELLDAVTVQQFERALAYARKEIAAGRAARLKEVA